MHLNHNNQEEVIDCSSLLTIRVDLLLTYLCPDYSRSQIFDYITSLLVDNIPVKRSFMVSPRNRITVKIRPQIPVCRALAIPHPLEIIYEDEWLLVIDKPTGIAVHPGDAMAQDEKTITQALCARESDLLSWQAESNYRAGVVHRLDKDTSGVLILAKTEIIAHELQEQFKARTVKKQYIAAVYGQMENKEGEVNIGIARDPKRRTRFTIAENGKNAHTIYKTMTIFDTYSMVRLFPITGRTHQLRIHLRYLGHPIIGDKRYAWNKNRQSALRLMLHAQQITFEHPQKNQRLTITATLPKIFEDAQMGKLSA